MMKIILMISLRLSESRFSVEKIVCGDFGIPGVSLRLAHGSIGITLLQDEETGARGEAVIHISGVADEPIHKAEINVELQVVVETITSIQASLGIAEISWHRGV